MKGLTSQQNKQTVRLAQYDNSWYNPGQKWKVLLWFVVSVLFFNNGFAIFNNLKCWLLRRFGAEVGKGVLIKPSVNIKYPWFLRVGNDVWVGENVWIDNLGLVIIGDNVCISQGAMLLTGNHNYKKSFFDLMIGEIILEDGVWIGAKATVCPGVTCRSHSVLSVSSVASSDLEAFGIYQGIPAQKIKIRTIN
jgi:putative colanic acid biosynthesis acetyltransferase WcaF